MIASINSAKMVSNLDTVNRIVASFLEEENQGGFSANVGGFNNYLSSSAIIL